MNIHVIPMIVSECCMWRTINFTCPRRLTDTSERVLEGDAGAVVLTGPVETQIHSDVTRIGRAGWGWKIENKLLHDKNSIFLLQFWCSMCELWIARIFLPSDIPSSSFLLRLWWKIIHNLDFPHSCFNCKQQCKTKSIFLHLSENFKCKALRR